MGWWTDRVVPRLTHATLNNPVVAGYRERVCAGLSGAVLEIGFGTGLNLAHLPEQVASVTAVEPSDLAWDLAGPAIEAAAVPVTRGDLRGEDLSLAADSVDSVLMTFSLCTVTDPARVLANLRRVLRPGGAVHYLEHGLAPPADARVRRWQHRLEPWQRRAVAGCHLTRSAPELLAEAGFTVEPVKSWYVPGPGVARPWGYVSLGRAVNPD